MRCALLIRVEPTSRVPDIEKDLSSFKEVKQIFEICGEYELLVDLEVKESEGISYLLDRLQDKKYIKDVRIFIVTKKVK